MFIAALCGCIAGEKTLAELEQESAKILADPDNVSRRKNIEPVFQLAAKYSTAGDTNKAIETYLRALEHQPWNLEAQISVAELQLSKGRSDAAREKAMLVWNRAETDALLSRAASLLNTNFSAKLPEQEAWPESTDVLALVPLGEVDAWLILDLRRELQRVLGIPVIIRHATLNIPSPGRDSVHTKAEELRQRLNALTKDRVFQQLLRTNNIAVKGDETDDEVFRLIERILQTERDKEPARRFREELGFLRRLGPQWDANALLNELRLAVTAVGGSRKGYLGVTKMDLYSNESRYVFGLAATGMNCGIVSYWRYRSALLEEPPNRDRLRERLLKQALSSAGFVFEVPRCTEPTCARAYANDLTEHDAKQPKLCASCREAFTRRFGKQ